MSSFTDKPVQFNPYISQLPVEAMVEVGMEKQKRYDEGVEKIQSSIDRIMDLDIVKDAHKQYLQSKLDTLGSNLRGVAAGDFSNSQLVKTVSGMAGKLGRDPIVQNAVSSTAFFRKQLGVMEDDRKAGKLSASNEYAFNSRASDWMQDKDLNTPFSVNYSPYFDISKYMTDVINTLKPDGLTSSQVFKTDDAGNILYNTYRDRTGQIRKEPILSTVMVTLKQKGIFPKKVQSVIDAAMRDPRVGQQLQIDGEYNFRGYDKNTLVQAVTVSMDEQQALNHRMLSELNLRRAVTKDGEELKEIDSKIEALRDGINGMNQSKHEIEQLDENTLRGMLQKSGMKNSWLQMYTNVEEETKYETSPYWEAEFKIQQEKNLQSFRSAELAQKERHFNATLKKDYDELAAKYTTESNPPTQDMMTTDRDFGAEFNTAYTQARDTYTEQVDDFILSTVLKGVDYNHFKKAYPGISDEKAKQLTIDAWAAREGKSPSLFRADYTIKGWEYLNAHPQELTHEMRARKTSMENAARNYRHYDIIKQNADLVAPVTEDSSDEEIERRNTYLQNNLYLYPNLKTTLMTGKAETDKKTREDLAMLIGTYKQAKTNASEGFLKNADNMTTIALSDDEGSVKGSASKNETTGEINHVITFYDKNGEKVGDMTVTAEEARQVHMDTSSWFKDPSVKIAEETLAVRGGKSSYGDPNNVKTYSVNDAFLMKSDFPYLSNTPYDVKANFKRDKVVIDKAGTTAIKYLPYLYVNPGRGQESFVRQLPYCDSVEEAIQKLTSINSTMINSLLSE